MIRVSDSLTGMFNAQADVSAEHLGALMYHMRVISELEVSDEHTAQFERDVAQLASEGCTVTQKLHVIDRMYHTYPFLHAQSVA